MAKPDTSKYPYDAVVYVVSEIGGNYFQGSGVLICPDEVLTASHVVYGAGVGAASAVEVIPAYENGSVPYGSATALALHYNEVGNPGGTISGFDSQSDYAVIHLSRSFAGLGTMGIATNFPGGDVNVTGYPAAAGGNLVSIGEQVAVDPDYTLLDDISIGPGSSGGPLWIATGSGADVVGVTSSEAYGAGGEGYAAQITTAAYDQIESWVSEDDAVGALGPPITVVDTTTGTPVPATSAPYSGPVTGLVNQFIDISSDSLNITIGTPNWFVHSGDGNDAIAVSSGTNVLDGGAGSNFLTGGSGTDTFFVDDRNAAAAIWSTVDDFHATDAATIWGVTQAADSFVWADGQGAADYTGLTLHATSASGLTASLTLAGFSSTDLRDGRLSVSFGTDPASGSPYMYIHENS